MFIESNVGKRLNAKMVKDFALKNGADLVGIASIDRFRDAPPETHPSSIMPSCRSVVVLAGRILEGSYQGNAQGADYSTYWIYGYGTGIYGPLGQATSRTMRFIESFGYDTIESPGGHTLLEAPPARPPVKKGKLPSNLSVHMRLAAAAAGLGELGWSKVFLSPEFGPRQRFEIFLTDAELEPDPLMKDHVCTRCMKCVDICPGQALSKTQKVSVEIEGRKFEWGDVHLGKCKLTHWGLNKDASPFIEKDIPGFNFDIAEQDIPWFDAFRLGFAMAPRIRYLKAMGLDGFGEIEQGTRPGSVCGAYGCVQACFTDLRNKKKLKGHKCEGCEKAKSIGGRPL
jgi:ferredoxin